MTYMKDHMIARGDETCHEVFCLAVKVFSSYKIASQFYRTRLRRSEKRKFLLCRLSSYSLKNQIIDMGVMSV
jgi:hypothetical protein